jgi:hypothetical protein
MICAAQTVLNLFYFLCVLKYFLCILHVCLNTFRIFSEYAEGMKNMEKDFLLLKIPDNFKLAVFQKYLIRDYIIVLQEQITN